MSAASSSSENIPGMIYPTTKGMMGSNPRSDAMNSMINQSSLQNKANAAVGGRRKRRYTGGDSTTNNPIVVPQYQMLYDAKGGPGTNPNNQIQGNAQTSTQMAANSTFDKHATTLGGSKKRKTNNKNNKNKKTNKNKNKK